MIATNGISRRAGRGAGLLAVAGVLMLLTAQPGNAQNSDIRSLAEQMQQLQRELSDLQRTVYSGAPAPAGAAAASGNLAASQEVRIQEMQSQMSSLTGRIEELGYQMQRLQERVDTLANAVGEMMRSGTQPAGEPMAEAPAEGASPTGSSVAGATATEPPAADGTPPPHTFQAQLAGRADVSGGTQPQSLTPPQTAAAPAAAYDLPGDTPDEQYQYAFGLLRQANYPEAERALRTFIERNPNSPLAGNAQYWLGETYYVRGDYQNAAVAFAEGYQKYPDSGKAPDNLLKLGMSLGEIGSKADACTALNELDKQFPGAPGNIKERAARERGRLGC